MSSGEILGIRDLGADFAEAAAALKSHNYDAYEALIVSFERPPTILTSGGFFPEVTFDGQALNVLGVEDREYSAASFHILNGAKGEAIVAIIYKKGDAYGKTFAESYVRQKPEHYTTLAIQMTFQCFENMCIRPDWWESLKKIEQDLLIRRMHPTSSLHNRKNYLEYSGITHDDWKPSSNRFAPSNGTG